MVWMTKMTEAPSLCESCLLADIEIVPLITVTAGMTWSHVGFDEMALVLIVEGWQSMTRMIEIPVMSFSWRTFQDYSWGMKHEDRETSSLVVKRWTRQVTCVEQNVKLTKSKMCSGTGKSIHVPVSN